MPNPKCNPKNLQKLDECIQTAQKRHSEADILAAARYLNLQDMLPEPHTLALFPISKDGYGSHKKY